jgi:Gas vesicle protein
MTPTRTAARELVETGDDSLLDLVDNLLNRGVTISGEVVLGLAGVDRVSCACRPCCARPTA